MAMKLVPAAVQSVVSFSRVESSLVRLDYGFHDHTSLVDVILHLNYPTILLDDLRDAASLEFSDNSIVMTFHSHEAFDHSTRALSHTDDVLQI